MSHTLVWDIMASTLDTRGIALSLLTQKPRYSVSVRLENDISSLNFSLSYVSLCRTFYRSLILYMTDCFGY